MMLSESRANLLSPDVLEQKKFKFIIRFLIKIILKKKFHLIGLNEEVGGWPISR
jgi:hypothetical protein